MRRKADILVAALLFFAFVLYLLPIFFEPARQLYSRILNPLTPAPDFLNQREKDLARLMRLQAQYEQQQDGPRQLEQTQLHLKQLQAELKLRPDNTLQRPGVAAEITSRHTLSWNTEFTLRFHSKAIIKPGDCVLSGGDLIGRIHSVKGNTAQVHTLLHKSTRISALLQGSEHFCSIEGGENSRELTLKALYFPRDIKANSGDLFVTAGYSEIAAGSPTIPAGLPIGKLVSSKRSEINQGLILRMRMPLAKIRYCLIIPGDSP